MPSPPKAVMLVTQEMEAACFAPVDLERIERLTALDRARHAQMTAEIQKEAVGGAAIVITGWGTAPLTRDLLDEAPDLALVCHSAGSIKHLVDAPLFQERGVRICSAAAALAVGVAEFTLGLMLVSMKAAWQLHGATSQGKWDRDEAMPWIREVYGVTIGIIGASLVGREVIRLCNGLDAGALLSCDPYVSEDEAQALGVEKVELAELMRRSDVVSLHTPATDETRRIIGEEQLALMKDRAIFINTARGMCVDETALITELQAGRIFACLDVTDPEPPVPDSPLYTLPNCVLTPHVAGAVKQNRYRQGRLVADAIEAFVDGRPLPGEVDLAQLHRLA